MIDRSMYQIGETAKMHQKLVLVLLATWWCVTCTKACLPNCVCVPEGRGQSVKCHEEYLPFIINNLPHNTARLQINGAALQTLHSADLENSSKSIQHLTITNTTLQELSDSAFSVAFTSLQELDLSNNQIKYISTGAFTGLSSLRLLNLSGNDLDDLGSCLEPLVSLQRLDLSFNFIHELQSSTLHSQSSLNYLRLDGNKIRSLNSESFQPLSFLTELRVQDCGISFVSESFLSAIPRVRLLDLGNNRLTSFPSSAAFTSKNQLLHLYLHGNKLLELQNSQFAGLHLLTLSLARNRIGVLEHDVFSELTVEHLDLSQNRLMELNPVALQSLAPHLLSLNLAYNPIRVLDAQSFGALGTLETLNISACSLDTVSAEIFGNLYNLRTLDMSLNNLQNVSKDLINIFNRLVKVNLQHNPWHCDCHIAPLREWLRSRQSVHKLLCQHGHRSTDCLDLQCSSPEELNGKLVYRLADPKLLNCNVEMKRSALSVPIQISIVLACLLLAFGMLILTIYLWRRGHTKRELKQIIFKKKYRNPDSHEEDEEEGQKIEPFLDCDNESLKESHRSFVFKEFFDKMVTDPKLLDPPSPSNFEAEEELDEPAPLPKQRDSMYSSNPSLYENSHKSCSVVVVGIESAV